MSDAPILIVRDSYLHGNPTRPLDTAWLDAERVHLGAITGRDVRTQYYDRIVTDDPMFCHAQFLDLVGALRPAFVWYRPSVLQPLIHRNLRTEVLYTARALYGARLVFGCGDLASPSTALYLAAYASIGDLSVAVDGEASRLAELAPGAATLDLWPAADGRLFRDLGRERDLDLCVVGETGRTLEQQAMLAGLEGLGLSIAVAADDESDPVAIDRRVDLLNRAKLSFRLPRAADDGRLNRGLLESILCGALPLDRGGGATSRRLAPCRHFVPFGDAADLAAKVRRYLANEPGRRSAVAAAKAHVGTTLSDRIWWRRLLEALDRV